MRLISLSEALLVGNLENTNSFFRQIFHVVNENVVEGYVIKMKKMIHVKGIASTVAVGLWEGFTKDVIFELVLKKLVRNDERTKKGEMCMPGKGTQKCKSKEKRKTWYIKQVRNVVTQFLNATNSKIVEQHNQCDKSFIGFFKEREAPTYYPYI